MFTLFGRSRAKKELAALVAILDPILAPYDFVFTSGESGVSSGGGFATGCYCRATEEIGLIFRGATLGAPNYTSGNFNTDHNGLMRELRRDNSCALWFDDSLDKWELVVRNGSSVTDAFVADLTKIVLPCIVETPDVFRAALASARRKYMNELRGGGNAT
jgi:hypothetical protein